MFLLSPDAVEDCRPECIKRIIESWDMLSLFDMEYIFYLLKVFFCTCINAESAFTVS